MNEIFLNFQPFFSQGHILQNLVLMKPPPLLDPHTLPRLVTQSTQSHQVALTSVFVAVLILIKQLLRMSTKCSNCSKIQRSKTFCQIQGYRDYLRFSGQIQTRHSRKLLFFFFCFNTFATSSFQRFSEIQSKTTIKQLRMGYDRCSIHTCFYIRVTTLCNYLNKYCSILQNKSTCNLKCFNSLFEI